MLVITANKHILNLSRSLPAVACSIAVMPDLLERRKHGPTEIFAGTVFYYIVYT